MVIETLEKKYTVLRNLYAGDHTDRFVCQDETTHRVYLMIRVRERDWIVKTLGFLTDQVNNREFADMVSCFFSGESLYIVMRHSEGVSLTEKLDDEVCTLTERIAVGRSILDQLLLQRMPEYFMRDCLDADRILLSHSLQVGFTYELKDIVDYGAVSFKDVQRRIASIWKTLFAHELKIKTLAGVQKFIDNLNEGVYADLMSVYKAYDEVCKKIAGMSDNELKKPKTKPFIIWEKFKRIWPYIKRIIALALLIAALVYLALTIKDLWNTGTEDKIFDYIGTLTIK